MKWLGSIVFLRLGQSFVDKVLRMVNLTIFGAILHVHVLHIWLFLACELVLTLLALVVSDKSFM